ncbi:hypothetical protein [Caloranaerobacter azorensis]|uniref:Uncharacterized protein n=1 Tax=Caloranaerobacter azorensis TaxID=116090 RepID=A0A6P1YB81_9FIRM|nr:hypothetical protein [Caloranaerobacter azorensis]QIB26118.1 hypothetical protein G3A45_01605 [Caloranaerobacter azorensis]
MNEEKCLEQRRFQNIEDDLRELKETVKVHSSEIADLKENQAETRIYVKQIFERIEDLKILFKSGTGESNEKWLKIIMELIKAIGLIAGIIAGIKIMG